MPDPRRRPMAEEGSGDPAPDAANPDTSREQRALQETYESPPPSRGDDAARRHAEMRESDEDLS